jgi:PAS domain S-box-containing protein
MDAQSLIEHSKRSSESVLGAVLESVKVGVCITDDRGRFVQVNRTYADMYGYQVEELVGQPFTLTLPLEIHSDAVREYYSLLMTHDEPILFKHRSDMSRDGQVFDVQILASRVVLEDRRRLLITFITKTNQPPRRLPKTL